MIDVQRLTKTYGDTRAVDDLSFAVRPGLVTGFLGPNGAGKSTTLRMILGLDRPDSGTARIDGVEYRRHPAPLRSVGALLDAAEVHPARRTVPHLLSLAVTVGAGRDRVREVLDLVGLTDVAHQRIGTFSLGMRQRLGIAAALLGDPGVVVLDEPVNGLDPDGVVWVRRLMRRLAAEGRTVLVSSHLMSEMARTADHLVVVGQGRLLADMPTAELIASSGSTLVVSSLRLDELLPHLWRAGAELVGREGDTAELRDVDGDQVATLALEHGIPVRELHQRERSLEQAFMDLTHASVQYQGATVSREKVPA